jgi:hypothetical protein
MKLAFLICLASGVLLLLLKAAVPGILVLFSAACLGVTMHTRRVIR